MIITVHSMKFCTIKFWVVIIMPIYVDSSSVAWFVDTLTRRQKKNLDSNPGEIRLSDPAFLAPSDILIDQSGTSFFSVERWIQPRSKGLINPGGLNVETPRSRSKPSSPPGIRSPSFEGKKIDRLFQCTVSLRVAHCLKVGIGRRGLLSNFLEVVWYEQKEDSLGKFTPSRRPAVFSSRYR